MQQPPEQPAGGPFTVLQMYDAALNACIAGDADSPTRIRTTSGIDAPLAVERWCSPADQIDREALARLRAALPRQATVIDFGCGPGRHVAHLAGIGVPALGVDISTVAVRFALESGADAVQADVFDPLPEQPKGWTAVLLLDGNIGLGGCPTTLLRRARELLSDDGRILVELDPDNITDFCQLQLSSGKHVSTPFSWARLGAREVARYAERAGLTVADMWTSQQRTFAMLMQLNGGHRSSTV